MKKIVGLHKQGGKVMKGKIEYYDRELLELVGKKGINKILNDIEQARKERANGFIGYPAEQVIKEMKIIVDEAVIQQ